MAETLLLPHGDMWDPGPVAAAQPPALPLNWITHEVKGWRVPHLPVATAALRPHQLPGCTVLGASTSNPGLWTFLRADRCTKEGKRPWREADRPAAEKPGVESFIRLEELSVLSLAKNSGKMKI